MKKVTILLVVVVAIVTMAMALSGCSNNSQYVNVPKELEKLWSSDAEFKTSECGEIYIPTGRELKVLQLTDIHYDHNNNKKPQTLELIKAVIKEANPDIVAVTGDWSSQRTDTLAHVKDVFDTIDGCKVPWAPVFGNHDAEGEVSRVDYIKIFAEYEHCMFNAGYTNIGGLGNYIINVRQDNAQGKLINSLIFLDSHSSTRFGVTKYLPMTKEQVAWYKWAVQGVNKIYQSEGNGKIIPSMAFFHIPAFEYSKAFDDGVIIGENKEKSYPPYKNIGLFDKMVELGSTKGIFVGHDHDNNAAAKYQGILLGYGVESGWCKGYAEGSTKGGLLISMQKNGEITLKQIVYDMVK